MEEIAMLYAGWKDENTPKIIGGNLVGYDIDKEVKIKLEDGMMLQPGFATHEHEDAVIRVFK